MAAITRVDLRLVTANVSGAGTDSDVYLGLGGREFFVDSAVNDFEQGSDRTYTFGTGPNVLNAGDNDPRTPVQIDTNDLDRFPRYIRMEPEGTNPDWLLEEVSVTVNPGQASQRTFTKLGGSARAKLGEKAGKVLYL